MRGKIIWVVFLTALSAILIALVILFMPKFNITVNTQNENKTEDISIENSDDNTDIPETNDESIPQNPTNTQGPINTQNPNIAFTLTIHNKEINILVGVDEKTLKKSPGWLSTSALPNENGMCVVYGHRNNKHLKILEQVKTDDGIIATMPDGSSYAFIVSEIQIIDTDDLQLPVINEKCLVLITCYPFRYSGNAPQKYVVVTKKV